MVLMFLQLFMQEQNYIKLKYKKFIQKDNQKREKIFLEQKLKKKIIFLIDNLNWIINQMMEQLF